MAAFYADENVPYAVSDAVRDLGHDVLTAQQDGRTGFGIDDPDVLARAIELDRAVLTNGRDDYHYLHRMDPNHAGIVTDDPIHSRIFDTSSCPKAFAGGWPA